MDLSPLQNAELFLVNTLFDLYMFILMIRFILCWVKAEAANPITRFIIKMTQPIIGLLRRLIPTYAGIEFATLFLIILLSCLKFFIASLVLVGIPHHPVGLLLLGFADTLKLVLKVFFYSIIIQAILSWAQNSYSPAARFFAQLTSPIMRPIQRFMPPIAGFDLSPIPALLLLHVSILLIAEPLISLGMRITFG